MESVAMNYQKEYDEYWSRSDRWGSHSFRDAGALAHQIEQVCGRGSALDVGCGMGLLVRTLVERGMDAKGVDIAQRVVDDGNRALCDRFFLGSILAIPFPDGAFDTVISTDCLEHIAESDVPQALRELKRVSRRSVFVQLATTPDRDGRWHLTIRDRLWWESQFLAAGFRKHPLSQLAVPYQSLSEESWQIILPFEKIPAAALELYPLPSLKAERDLHMDMLREAGPRSEAHLARYQLAAQHAPETGVILDAACGLGYGSAMIARQHPQARVIGVDNSPYAIRYAKENFAGDLPNLEFHQADVCDLGFLGDRHIDCLVSFETLEHIPDPRGFFEKVGERMNPGASFIGSVPNLWVDETGKDPSPYHLHVFDYDRFHSLVSGFWSSLTAYRQNADRGVKGDHGRVLQSLEGKSPSQADRDHAEWWIIAARNRAAQGALISGNCRSDTRVSSNEPAEAFRACTKVDKQQWQAHAQEGEFEFHKNNKWRPSPDFSRQTAELFAHFALKASDFRGKTVLDLGAGSKLRSKYFKESSIIAIEPLANRFINEIPWCDLTDASEVYSVSAEEPVAQCRGRADLLISINVLDHCYNFEKAVRNIRDYLRDDGIAFLSFDKHETADEMHPLALNEATCEQVFKGIGFTIERCTRGMGSSHTYGHGPYCLNYWLRKARMPQPGQSLKRPVSRKAWLVCSNSSHVKLMTPVAKQLRTQNWEPTFVSLDNFYGQGASKALRDLKIERLEVPTRTPDGDWHERSQEERDPWNAEATMNIEGMFTANAPDAVLLGNDTGFLEQKFIQAAKTFRTLTALLQEGALRSSMVDAATGQPAPVMGDGGCDLICTWGEGLADRLRARGVKSIVEPTGNPLFDSLLPDRSPRHAGARDTVLVIGQCFGKYGEYSLEREHSVYEQIIAAIVARNNYRVVFKVHPQQDVSYYTALHQRMGMSFELMTSGESLASIQSADVVVSVASTMALEAFRLGVPALTLHYLAPFEVPDLIRLPGGCQSESEFCRFLDSAESWKALQTNLETNEEITRQLFYKLDGNACERIVAALGRVVASGVDESEAIQVKSHHSSNEGPGWRILRDMYVTKKAPDLCGRVWDLELAGVSEQTGALLYDLVREVRPKQTLETGFAYGFSALFILQALVDNGVGVHKAIDPVETHRWHGIGLANVKRAGFERIFTLLEEPSQLALPAHYGKGFKIDFAFIDGSHLFDETLLDAYYMDRMLAPGGLIVLDDWDWLPAVRAAANFIETNLSYEVIAAPQAPKVRVLRKVKSPARAWNHFVPFQVPTTCTAETVTANRVVVGTGGSISNDSLTCGVPAHA